MSVEQTNAASARPLSAASPAAIPCTGPLPSRGSSTTTVPSGRSGRSWPPARTTTTGPSAARATIPTVRRSSVDPCHSSAAFAVPIREDRPPASTTPAEPAISSWYASPGLAPRSARPIESREDLGALEHRIPADAPGGDGEDLECVRLVSATDALKGGETGLAVRGDRFQAPVRSALPENPFHEQAVIA